MAKYEPLVRYLRRQKKAEVELSFRDIERIVGGLLPKASANLGWWRVEHAPSALPQQREQGIAEIGWQDHAVFPALHHRQRATRDPDSLALAPSSPKTQAIARDVADTCSVSTSPSSSAGR